MMESIKPMPKRRLRSEERRALAMLADAPFGYTGSILLVNGFKAPTLARLVRNGLDEAAVKEFWLTDEQRKRVVVTRD
jgi:hypothetical protein